MKYKFSLKSIEKLHLDDKLALNPQDRAYLSAKTQKRVRLSVILAHVLLLMIPLIVGAWVWLFTEKEVEVVSISLAIPSLHKAPVDLHAKKAAQKASKTEPKKQKKEKKKKEKSEKQKTKKDKNPERKQEKTKTQSKAESKNEPDKWERMTSKTEVNPPPAKVIGEKPVIANPNASPTERAIYLAQLKAEIDPEFEKLRPSKFDIGGATPINEVEVTIDADGNITNCKFIKLSGVPAMDEAVRKLFLQKRKVIAPAKGPFPFITTINFGIE